MKNIIIKKILNESFIGSIFGVVFLLLLFFPGTIGLASFYKYFSTGALAGFLACSSLLFLYLWFSKKKDQSKRFYLNKIFLCFIAYYFTRDLIAFTSNYHLINSNILSFYYFIACGFRFFIFCCMILFINLLFRTSYSKKAFYNTVLLLLFFFTLFYLCCCIFFYFTANSPLKGKSSYLWYLTYATYTKPAMILFLLILFQLFVKKVHWVYWCLSLVCVQACSFQGKRASLILGITSIVLFFILYLQNIRNIKHKKTGFFFITIVFTVLVFKIMYWHGSYPMNRLFESRKQLSMHFLNMFLQQDLLTQVVGNGDLLDYVSYPHNVVLALLLSVGAIGLFLWLWSFGYVGIQFFKFKGKSFVDFVLWVILGMYFLNSFTTGFYLYHTPLYFILYFMEYRYKYWEGTVD